MAIIGALPYILTNGTTADATQVMADLNYLVSQVNANAAAIGALVPSTQNVRSVVTSGGSTQLAPTDGYVLISNTVASLAVSAPIAPAINQLVTIKDAAGTAAAFAITFSGTIDGASSPTLIDFAYGTAQILFSGGNIYRVL